MRINARKWSVLIPIVMLPLGIWLGYRAFGDRSFSDLVNAIRSIPPVNLALAFGFTACSYLCLTFFDVLALRYAGRKLAYPRVALTSFVSLSIGHNIGVAALSSGALRYRFYARFGISAVDVGRVILFSGVTVALGLMTLGGVMLALLPDFGAETVGLSPGLTRAVALLSLVAVAGYVALACKMRWPLRIRGHEFRLPTAGVAALQVVLGTADFVFVSAALHQLLAGAVGYPQTIAAYVLGNGAALLSHVPGGLGVLEYVIATLVGGEAIGALIAFRIVYFFVPLAVGSALLLIAELTWLRRR